MLWNVLSGRPARWFSEGCPGTSRRRGALCSVAVPVWVLPRQAPGFPISLACGRKSGNVEWQGRWVNGGQLSRHTDEQMKRGWVGRRMVGGAWVDGWIDGWMVNRWVDGYLLLQGQFLWGSKDRKEERKQVAGLSGHHRLFFSQHGNFSASMPTVHSAPVHSHALAPVFTF